MPFFLTRHRLLAALAAIFALTIAIRAPFNSNVGVDEAYYLVIGRQWLHGVPLYAGSYDVKPPLLFLLMAGAEALFGPTLLAAKALTTASVAITAFGLYLLGRRIAGELVRPAGNPDPSLRAERNNPEAGSSAAILDRHGAEAPRDDGVARQDFPRGVLAGGAAALLYIFSALNLGGTLSPAELIMAPFTTFGMLMGLAALSNDGPQRIYSLLAAGLLFGAAACIKQTASFEAVAFAPLLAWSCRANLLQACGAFAVGCCAVPAGFALYFGAIGHLSDLFDMAAVSALRRTSASFAPAWSEAFRRMAIEALQILPAVILAACFWASRRAPGDRACYGSAPLVQPAARSHPVCRERRHANFRPVSCTSIKDLLVRLIRGKSCQRQPHMGQDLPRGVLVQPEASSHPLAARSQANLPPISCTRFNKLLVRLIRGKSCQCQLQMGQDFPRGVLG